MKNSDLNTFLLEKAITNGTYPEILYKYRTFKQTKEIICNNCLFFVKSDSFNDPFDCNLSEIVSPTTNDIRQHFLDLNINSTAVKRAIGIYSKSPQKVNEPIQEIKNGSIKSCWC